MSNHPYELTAPVSMTVQPGAAGTFEVANTGTKPLAVRESLVRVTSKAIQYPAASHATMTSMSGPWLTVWPASFSLSPGQVKTVHIASHVPAGQQGNHFLNVAWSFQPLHAQAGAVHAAGAVATTVTIPLAGTATPVTSHAMPTAAPAPGHGGSNFPAMAAGVGVVLLAMAVLAGVAVILRRRWQVRRERQAWFGI